MGSSDAGPLRRLFGFSFAAPKPPLTFLSRKTRVARLGDGGVERVQDAGVLVLAGEALEARVHFLGVLLRKLGDGMDAQAIEIAEHRGADGDEVAELALGSHRGCPFYSLYFRHRINQTLPHPGWSAQEEFMRAANEATRKKEANAMVRKITAVLFVKEIEPVLAFWTDGLGFTKTVEVPEGNKLGFVILEKDGVEVMYQTYASADKDVPSVAADVRKGPTFLYVQVDDLESVKAALKRAQVYLPERKTFYGATEIGVKDPAGHFITFAQLTAAPQH
jgi:uncharacterized glyoxalase superfamily protein PhnB